MKLRVIARVWPARGNPWEEAAQQRPLCPFKAAFLQTEVPKPQLSPQDIPTNSSSWRETPKQLAKPVPGSRLDAPPQ